MKKKLQYYLAVAVCLIAITLSGQECNKNYLTARGNKLYDASGQEVLLRGVNWFGFETSMGYFHGIWCRDHKSMLRQIKDLGFNCIRIPWNNAILDQDITGKINAYGTDPYTGVSPMNEEESAKTKSLEILDIAIKWCQENNMKVILDNHSREPDGYMVEQLWYTGNVSHEQWIQDWVFIANRYKNYDAVIAMDINNEPHGAYGAGARWGTGNPENDWRLAAQECGNAILEVNPNLLIMVEGTEEFEETSYWWGGNLQGAREYPVVLSNPEKLVYSPHEYGPTVHNQDWFSDPAFPDNMEGIWEENFNYLHTEGVSPLFFGEFGIRDAGGKDEIWFDEFVRFMGDKGHHWTFWCWNPNSGDTGGLLDNQWKTVVQWKMDKLRPHLATEIPNCRVVDDTVRVTGVKLSSSVVTLYEGESENLYAEVLPTNATNKLVRWSSDNNAAADVSNNGVVQALAEGQARIIVTTADGNYSDACIVTVLADTIQQTRYTLNINTIGSGSVTVSPNENSYIEGSIVKLTANAGDGYFFKEWGNDLNGSQNPISLVIDADKVVSAIFSEVIDDCSLPQPAALPVQIDGDGEYCLIISEDIAFINSWNMDVVEINGIDFTNKWSSSLPAKQNGEYKIYLKGSYPWSHFEAMPILKNAKPESDEGFLSLYPNPFKEYINLKVLEPETIKTIQIFNVTGKMVQVYENGNIHSEMKLGYNLPKGLYRVFIYKESGIKNYMISKQ